MGDHLEQFIVKNRDKFDSKSPSEKVWSAIDDKLQKKQSPLSIGWKIAAMIFLASTILLIYDRVSLENDVPQFSNEFKEAESFYTQLINQKRLEVEKKLPPEQHALFLSEIDQLDTLYNELKNNYLINASNEMIIDAMINNLQIRLKILNKQIEILEKFKANENEIQSI